MTAPKDATQALQRLWRALDAAPKPELTPQLALAAVEALDVADAAASFTEQSIGGGTVGVGTVRELADRLAATGRRSAGLSLLFARVAEAEGDAAGAEAHLREALRLAPRYPPALIDAATIASDRGDAGRAMTLLLAAGVPADDPELALLRDQSRPGTSRTPRNAPCPCGSGRKFKHCCTGVDGRPLIERSGWLYAKAVTFVQRPPQRQALFAVAGAFAHPSGPADAVPEAVVAAACDPLVVDLCLFEGGQLQAFLARRGTFLPPDERELLGTWCRARHRVWSIDRGSDGTVLTDVLDGRTHAIRSPWGGESRGEVLAVVIDRGDGEPMVPGATRRVPVSLLEPLRAAVAARADGLALARLVGAPMGWTAPPEDLEAEAATVQAAAPGSRA